MAASPIVGKALFNANKASDGSSCVSCHFDPAVNNTSKIRNGANNANKIATAISQDTGGMRIFAGRLTSGELADIAAYIASPALNADTALVNFNFQQTSTTSLLKTFNIINLSTRSVNLSNITLTGLAANDYFWQGKGGTCTIGTNLAAGAQCSIKMDFVPANTGTRSASLNLAQGGQYGVPPAVSLTGEGKSNSTPSIASDHDVVDFGTRVIGATSTPQVITLSNSGNAVLSITQIRLIGSSASDFTLTGCPVGTYAPAASCQLSVDFLPTIPNTTTAQIEVTSNGSANPMLIDLTGTGAYGDTQTNNDTTPTDNAGNGGTNSGSGANSGTTSSANTAAPTGNVGGGGCARSMVDEVVDPVLPLLLLLALVGLLKAEMRLPRQTNAIQSGVMMEVV